MTKDGYILPTPTEVVIDVFATQTAMALIPTPTPVEPTEVTPEETIVPPTDEATEAPTEEQKGVLKFDGERTFDRETDNYYSGTSHE